MTPWRSTADGSACRPEDAVEEYLARATFGVEEKEPPRARVRLKHLKL